MLITTDDVLHAKSPQTTKAPLRQRTHIRKKTKKKTCRKNHKTVLTMKRMIRFDNLKYNFLEPAVGDGDWEFSWEPDAWPDILLATSEQIMYPPCEGPGPRRGLRAGSSWR